MKFIFLHFQYTYLLVALLRMNKNIHNTHSYKNDNADYSQYGLKQIIDTMDGENEYNAREWSGRDRKIDNIQLFEVALI
jgi:hypothetical protein